MKRREFLLSLMGGAAMAPFSLLALPMQRARRVVIQCSPIAGFQYHEGGKVWPRLRVGERLELVREPGNRYDERAVRVDWRGRKLGYVPRMENAAVAQMLDRGERISARIVNLRESNDPWQRIHFEVLL